MDHHSVLKKDLRLRIEPGLLSRMDGRHYRVVSVPAPTLVTWNRLDIGFRTLFLELKRRCPGLAAEIYHHDLRAQTLGAMIDPDNATKDRWEVFETVFESVSNSIERIGFDSSTTLLPVSTAGSILNGCHRLSAALVHRKTVSCVYTNLAPITCDYKYFFDRAVPIDMIERSARQLMLFAENTFIAFLWPSGNKYIPQAEVLFENVILRSKLELKENGPFNLLYQCYHHMDWVGSESSGYPGLRQKVMECFPNGGGSTVVIAFQAHGGVSEVRAIKERIREMNGIGYSSVHITDTKEEAVRIADLVFNENGRHYLDFAKPIRASAVKRLRQVHKHALGQGVDPKDFLLDGSWLLELYGIREAEDIDVLASPEACNAYEKLGFDRRDEQLVFHGLSENELIFDSSNYFILFGVKLVGFRQLQRMKAARGEPKDKNDLKLMSCFLEDRKLRAAGIRLKQIIAYSRLKIRRQIFRLGGNILRGVGLYGPVRAVWRQIKGRKQTVL